MKPIVGGSNYIDLNKIMSGLDLNSRQQAPSNQAFIPEAEQNLWQRSGVTDPNLQNFGSGIGKLFNIETRSSNQMLRDQLKNIDLSSKSGLREAAKIYLQLGESEPAIQLLKLAND